MWILYNVLLVGVLFKRLFGKKRFQRRSQIREMEGDNVYEIVYYFIFVLQRMGKLLCLERNWDFFIKVISFYNRCICMYINGVIIKNLFNKM